MPGKKGQDWSYLTDIRALWRQMANVVDPALIPDYSIIDTTKQQGLLNGAAVNNDRARQQTLVVHCIRLAASSIDGDVFRLGIWIDSLWSSEIIEESADLISSSSSGESRYPALGSITAQNRWSLIEVATLDSVFGETTTIVDDRSYAFTFPWMPAGRYKIGVLSGLGAGDEMLLAEQHTE